MKSNVWLQRGIIHWTLLIKNCPHTRRICQSKSTKICGFDEKINDVIVKTKDDIYDRTITALAKEANEKYIALTTGNQSSGGKLLFERNHDVVNVSIRDVQNGEITGLGTGFQRMKQLAIVMAIISSKIGDEKNSTIPLSQMLPSLNLVKTLSIISSKLPQEFLVKALS